MSSASHVNAAPVRKHAILGPRLSLMMFMQYAVWGAWLPIIGRYLSADLGFSGYQVGAIAGTAAAVGAILAPFIAGQIADRVFSAERYLFVAMLAGGALQFVLAEARTFEAWLWLSVVYSVIYMPTIAISNSLTFAHLEDRDRQFPPIRLWGTIGWIAVSWAFPILWLQHGVEPTWKPPFFVGKEHVDAIERLGDALRLSGIISIVYGLYCLSLPHTPPRKAVEKIAFAKAFGLLRHRGFLVLTLAAIPISLVHTIYFIQTPNFLPQLAGMRDADTQPAMSVGQFSEILVLAVLGLLIRGIGFRWLLTIGCAAYIGRYMVFAMGAPTELVVASIALHGVCFACFYATAFVYVDRVAPADVRHSAQTVFGILLLGVGPLFAGPVMGRIAQDATVTATIAECKAAVNLVPQKPEESADATTPGGWDRLYPGAAVAVKAYEEANPNGKAGAWRVLRDDVQVTALDFGRFWRWNAAIAGIGMAMVALLFRVDPSAREAAARE
ncbi:MAG: MFS transporter [Planctomycetia bacterium]|nr:MAG: MFS transporter [Planctomycetia bacterium]